MVFLTSVEFLGLTKFIADLNCICRLAYINFYYEFDGCSHALAPCHAKDSSPLVVVPGFKRKQWNASDL